MHVVSPHLAKRVPYSDPPQTTMVMPPRFFQHRQLARLSPNIPMRLEVTTNHNLASDKEAVRLIKARLKFNQESGDPLNLTAQDVDNAAGVYKPMYRPTLRCAYVPSFFMIKECVALQMGLEPVVRFLATYALSEEAVLDDDLMASERAAAANRQRLRIRARLQPRPSATQTLNSRSRRSARAVKPISKRQQEAQAKALQDSRAHAKANVVEVVGDKMREPRWCFMCNANSKQNSPGKQSSHRRRSGLREGRRKPRSCQ
jgi:hypothetical protein